MSEKKSKFSGNFRSGLKLPVLPRVNKSLEDDCTLVDKNLGGGDVAVKNHTKKKLIKNKVRSNFTPKWDGITLVATGVGLSKDVQDDEIETAIKCKIDLNLTKERLVDVHKARGDHHNVSQKTKVHENAPCNKLSVTADDSLLDMFSEKGDEEDSAIENGVEDVYKDGKLILQATQNKGDNLESEINQRISSVYRSIENLEKKRLHFNNSIRAATRRTVADGVKNKAIMSKLSKLSVATSATTKKLDSQINDESDSRKKSSRVIDVTRTYPKMFGLDPMKVIASSEDDSDLDENGVKHSQKKTKKSIRKYVEQLVKQEKPRDMSAIMPTLSEKTFLTKLQKRENQLNKEINDMRNNLDVMNTKAEREAKKAKVGNRDQHFNKRQSNVTKLITSDPRKGPGRELTDFLQATGGAGGWEVKDHMAFLRGFRKWSTRPIKLVDNLCQLLSSTVNKNKKPEDIIEHIGWQEKFEKLHSANQAHIRQWQMSRKREPVYQMASQSHKARLENEKRQQDLIRLKRDDERERNHRLLMEWKRSKTLERHSMKERDADLELNNTSEKIAKMDLEMNNVRKEIRDITTMTKEIGKSLQSVGSSDSILDRPRKSQGGRSVKTASAASSGFCEMEIEALANELTGDGESFICRTSTCSAISSNFYTNSFHRDPSQIAQTRRMLQEFRNRDEEMMNAKKKAILVKKQKMRNSAFLSDQQVKERRSTLTSCQSVSTKNYMCPTKGWTIRNEIREQEKIEHENRERDDGNVWSSESKDSITTTSYINNIPKLGTPAWRKTTAS